MAKILPFPPIPSEYLIHEAVSCVEQAGVLAFATESFYAFGAGVDEPQAIQRIVDMKGDRESKPILLLIGERTQLVPLVARLPQGAEALMERFWPGPLTLVLPAVSNLCDSLTGRTHTIGIRQPSGSALLTLLRSTGPLTGTSANHSGRPPLDDSKGVQEIFGEDLDLILDSGKSPGGMPSTIVNLVQGVRVVREGPISSGLIQEVLSREGLTLAE